MWLSSLCLTSFKLPWKQSQYSVVQWVLYAASCPRLQGENYHQILVLNRKVNFCFILVENIPLIFLRLKRKPAIHENQCSSTLLKLHMCDFKNGSQWRNHETFRETFLWLNTAFISWGWLQSVISGSWNGDTDVMKFFSKESTIFLHMPEEILHSGNLFFAIFYHRKVVCNW